MQNQVEHPVILSTGVPILIPAGRNEPWDGLANYHRVREGDVTTTKAIRVRVVTAADFERIKEVLGDSYPLLEAALNLRTGFETGDEIALQKGFSKLEADTPPELIQFYASTPHWAETRFPTLISEQIEGAQIVMYHSPKSKRFVPAFLCPDLKTGLMLMGLIDVRACPKCSRLFVPRASNVFYCSPAHRDAYRVNRARLRKQIQLQKRSKGKQHATR
jgi:hypothetical protein